RSRPLPDRALLRRAGSPAHRAGVSDRRPQRGADALCRHGAAAAARGRRGREGAGLDRRALHGGQSGGAHGGVRGLARAHLHPALSQGDRLRAGGIRPGAAHRGGEADAGDHGPADRRRGARRRLRRPGGLPPPVQAPRRRQPGPLPPTLRPHRAITSRPPQPSRGRRGRSRHGGLTVPTGGIEPPTRDPLAISAPSTGAPLLTERNKQDIHCSATTPHSRLSNLRTSISSDSNSVSICLKRDSSYSCARCCEAKKFLIMKMEAGLSSLIAQSPWITLTRFLENLLTCSHSRTSSFLSASDSLSADSVRTIVSRVGRLTTDKNMAPMACRLLPVRYVNIEARCISTRLPTCEMWAMCMASAGRCRHTSAVLLWVMNLAAMHYRNSVSSAGAFSSTS